MVALSSPALSSVSSVQVVLTPLGFLPLSTVAEPVSDYVSHLHFQHHQAVFLRTLAAIRFLQETAGPLERCHKIPTLSLTPTLEQYSLWLLVLGPSLYGTRNLLRLFSYFLNALSISHLWLIECKPLISLISAQPENSIVNISGMPSWCWVTAMHNSQLARTRAWSHDVQVADQGWGENAEEGERVPGQMLNLSPTCRCEGPAWVLGDKIGLFPARTSSWRLQFQRRGVTAGVADLTQ